MKLNFPKPDIFMDEVKARGFSIVKDAIPLDFIDSQRERWLPKFVKKM